MYLIKYLKKNCDIYRCSIINLANYFFFKNFYFEIQI